jgi:exosortase N
MSSITTNLRIPGPKLILSVSTIILMIIVFIWQKPGYLLGDTKFWFGLISLPLSFSLRKEPSNHRFALVTLVLILMSAFFTTTVGLFLILIVSGIYIIERHFGKVSYVFLCHALLLSPLVKYVLQLISIPLRLQLTKFAGWALNITGTANEVSGNIIEFNGVDFLVDQACAGLSMMFYGILFGTLIMAHHEKRLKAYSLLKIGMMYLILLLLTLSSNFIRIILMIIFNIGQEALMHEALGLILFFVYVLLPFFYISRAFGSKKSPEFKKVKESFTQPITLVFLIVSFIALSYKNSQHAEKAIHHSNQISLDDVDKEILRSGVIKFHSTDLLLYIKPPVSPYKADHNPMICWQGSGYSFKKIFVDEVNGQKMHFAELVKDQEKLYTAWWFDSGNTKAASQWEWRLKALESKEQFYLINASSHSIEALKRQIEKLTSIELISQS